MNKRTLFISISLIVVAHIHCTEASAQVEINNGISGDGSWSVEVLNGGGSRRGDLDPGGAPGVEDVLFDYLHYVDVNGSVTELANTTITSEVSLTGSNRAGSAGTFQGENGTISWTADGWIATGGDSYLVTLNFSSSQPFGNVRFIQYLDEDVESISDDLLVVIGTSGQSDFQLLTIDGPHGYGVAHGARYTQATNMTYAGWAADEYSELKSRIRSSSQEFSIVGEIDYADSLPPTTDSRYPNYPVYGPEDVTSAVAFDLSPTATSASVTLFLGGSAEGDPVDPNPDPEDDTDEEDHPLSTPVHTKYNTYLGQYNFLELVNAGTEAMEVAIVVYNFQGQVMVQTAVSISATSQVDVDINALITQACTTSNPTSCTGLVDLDGNGVVDTYGLVRLDFVDDDPNKILMGRMSHYRPNPGGVTYSFAFARELRNPTTGPSYATSNTYDPQNAGYLVPNWVEVINLHSSAVAFTFKLYDQSGDMLYSDAITVQPLGEADVPGGHQIQDALGNVSEGVYLVEVIPEDEEANYLMYLTRYSSNSSSGSGAATYNFAFALNGRDGSGRKMRLPALSGMNPVLCATATTWIEVVNVTSTPRAATVIFRDSTGTELNRNYKVYTAKSQFHYNASAVLQAYTPGGRGSVEVIPVHRGSILAQALIYYHDCDRTGVSTAYVVPGLRTDTQTATLTGSVNTFLTMGDNLVTISAVGAQRNLTYSCSSFTGFSNTGTLGLPGNGTSVLDISSPHAVNFPANAYGIIAVTSDNANEFAGHVLRIRTKVEAGRTRYDYVMPTKLRAARIQESSSAY